MEQDQVRDSKQVAAAAIVSAVFCQLTCHPFGVLSVRQQRQVREIGLGQPQKFNPFSMIQTAKFIFKQEGIKTFYNGLRYSLSQTIIGTSSMLVSYEKTKQYLRENVTDNVATYSLGASLLSTFISTTLSFPLEYWKTISQSYEGDCQVRNFQLGKKIYSAYSLTLSRQMVFFSVYWPSIEVIRKTISGLIRNLGFSEHSQIIIQNLAAGCLAGTLSAIVTQPIDIVKTRKQVFDEMQGLSFYRSFIQIYQKQGIQGFLGGVKARVLGVICYGCTMLCTYETIFSKMVQLNKLQQSAMEIQL